MGSNSAKAYINGGRRYNNKLRKVRKHIKRCGDKNAARWLKGAMGIFSMDYKRGAEPVKKLHAEIYGRGVNNRSRERIWFSPHCLKGQGDLFTATHHGDHQ